MRYGIKSIHFAPPPPSPPPSRKILILTLGCCGFTGYFDAPGTDVAPLRANWQNLGQLPFVTLVFCTIDKLKDMKVSEQVVTKLCSVAHQGSRKLLWATDGAACWSLEWAFSVPPFLDCIFEAWLQWDVGRRLSDNHVISPSLRELLAATNESFFKLSYCSKLQAAPPRNPSGLLAGER